MLRGIRCRPAVIIPQVRATTAQYNYTRTQTTQLETLPTGVTRQRAVWGRPRFRCCKSQMMFILLTCLSSHGLAVNVKRRGAWPYNTIITLFCHLPHSKIMPCLKALHSINIDCITRDGVVHYDYDRALYILLQVTCIILTLATDRLYIKLRKAVPLRAMEALEGRGGIAPTHS
jgi:hypothetical protein